jgi:hypothetical protein
MFNSAIGQKVRIIYIMPGIQKGKFLRFDNSLVCYRIHVPESTLWAPLPE